MPPSSTSKDRQNLVVHEYFRPWLAAHGSAFSVASNLQSLAVDDLQEHGYDAQRSRDKALASFAQLAALRLNVRRAMISLIDSKHQYILTEATRTQSFLSTDAEHSSDDLWLGSAVLDREEAVCCHCFQNTYTARNKDGREHTTRALVIPDCRLDERFKARSYVRSERGVRFYAGVPILTRSGVAIGAYAVSDESPRHGLDVAELNFLEGVSAAIMEHLEWARDRVDKYKSDRIVRGLTSFIDRSLPLQVQYPRPAAPKNSAINDVSDPIPATVQSSSLTDDLTADFGPDRRLAYLQSHVIPLSDSDSDHETSDGSRPENFPGQAKLPTENHDLHHILRRAARSLRKSALADGVLFFKALEDPLSDQDAEIIRRSSDTMPIDERWDDNENDDVRAVGVSLQKGPLAEEQVVDSCQLSKLTLATYFLEFPNGKAINFSSDGQEMYSEDEDDDIELSPLAPLRGIKRVKTWKERPRYMHGEILRKLPGIRTLIFLPLRDFITGKWIAGGFLWSCNSGRLMNMEDDLPQLQAFANGIVSEIARFNVEQLSRSKTAFIASMSHDLRNPIHGILGSTEILSETKLDTYQSGLISSVNNCSRTLLDTLSNLLSYAKASQTQAAMTNTQVDVALLTEEVVEAVCAGQAYRKGHISRITAMEGNTPGRAPEEPAESTRRATPSGANEQAPAEVYVLLDIIPAGDWRLMTNPGAIRRILMNLLGNSLKYTDHGFVAASLRLDESHDKNHIILKVTDTGKGISSSFIKNNIFQAFKQENVMASGTGLGLSIVKQLIESLGGQISVQSVLGKGTEFQVTLPTQPLPGTGIGAPDDEEDLEALRSKLQGVLAAVIIPEADDSPTLTRSTRRLKSNLVDLCTNWYGMRVENFAPAGPQPDVIIYARSTQSPPSIAGNTGRSASKAAVVVLPLGSDGVRGSTFARLAPVIEVLSQPCGPRKVGRTIARCLDACAHAQQPPESNYHFSPSRPNLQEPTTPPCSLAVPASGERDIALPITPGREPTPRRILIVDDNSVNMDLLVRFVRKSAVKPSQATNGQEAVDVFIAAANKGERFDYILMDVSMPIMDGLEASRRIRSYEEEKGLVKTKIVALSAHESESMGIEAGDSGVDLFLNKPIRFKKLKEILEQDLG